MPFYVKMRSLYCTFSFQSKLCCINELSVDLFHQNLKLGADFTLKNDYKYINVKDRSASAFPMGPGIQSAHGMGALI